jgi:DNA ligase D-like protein (predicted ligase)
MSLWEELIKPMLAFPSKPFNDKEWLYEIKFDGTRTICYIDKKNENVRFLNRRLLWFQDRYPELKDIWKNCEGEKIILDGEIVVFDRGKPNFWKLAEREHVDDELRIQILSKKYPATLIVFDILHLDGKDLIDLPLIKRKKILEEVVKETKNFLISETFEEGIELFEKVKEMKLEGIMAKKKDSVYEIGKRSKKWLKIKAIKTMDAIICGFTKGEGKREKYFGALLLGVWDQGKLRYIGRVGTGNWSETDLEKMKTKLEKLKVDFNPFDIFEEEKEIIEKTTFVKPEIVVEIEFLEFTQDKKLRAPSFKRIRLDKTQEECVLAE